MKPIYEPKGKAKEYGDYALNIYTGCPHRCYYCFAPNVLHKDREAFHSNVQPRANIIEETRRQLEREKITGKLIHLCFTCDPYPTDEWDMPTREIITLLKNYGNHVQILTKGNGSRDLDLLDSKDMYGITYDGSENRKAPIEKRIYGLRSAQEYGIGTWVSFEPILSADCVIDFLYEEADSFKHFGTKLKFGKLNYYRSDIDWAKLGRKIETFCKQKGLDYYIKDSLRAEMEKQHD